jgi:hypothetical protein
VIVNVCVCGVCVVCVVCVCGVCVCVWCVWCVWCVCVCARARERIYRIRGKVKFLRCYTDGNTALEK